MCRRACLWRRVVPRAAKFCRVKRRTSALAGHRRAGITDHLQLRRAVSVQVGDAASVLTVAVAAGRLDSHANVVAVDEADVVEVLVGGTRRDGELC